tara:strand:- start:17 stop:718 length:702 start_codon:yes stop_codon:yes gene_type:complete
MVKKDIVIWYRVYLPTGGDTDIMMRPLEYSSFSNWQDDFTEKLEEINFTDFEIVDYDYIGESDAYSIYQDSNTWDAWNDLFDLAKEYGIKPGVLIEHLQGVGYGIEQAKDVMENSYEGEHSNMRDFAYYIVDEEFLGEDQYEMYFDYENFGRELKWDYTLEMLVEEMDFSVSEAEDLLDLRDGEFAEWYIDGMGDVKELGMETIKAYFDYQKLERTLDMEGYYEVDGHIFRPY